MQYIYLAGAISGLSWEKAEGWRIKVKSKIDSENWLVIDPCAHIPHKNFTTEVERECMRWDLFKLKKSDLVVCDFSHPNSIGTTWELGVAYEKGIPIIGVMTEPSKEEIHPWWRMAAIHVCDNLEDLYHYLNKQFLHND